MTLGDIIKEYRERNKMTMQEFADKAGLSKGAISMLEKNKRPGSNKPVTPTFETYAKVANAIGKNMNELLEVLDSVKIDVSKPKVEAVQIPVLGKIPAGVPIEEIEDVIGYEEITDKLADRGEYFALKVTGDSMEPKIHDEDVVIVRCQPDAETGDVVIATVNGCDGTCKRLKKTDAGLMLLPFNSSYDPYVFTWKEVEEMPVKIIGKVIEARSKF